MMLIITSKAILVS